MVDWPALAMAVDVAVDDTFGERVNIVPWAEGGYAEAGPDPSRSPSGEFIACFVLTGATALDTSAGIRASDSMYLSLREDEVPDGCRKGDRVQMLDRGWTAEISWIEPGPTMRTKIHMLRLKDDL